MSLGFDVCSEHAPLTFCSRRCRAGTQFSAFGYHAAVFSHEAGIEAGAQLVLIKVLSDEHEPIHAWCFSPWLEHLTREEHVHTLVDVLVVAARHGQYALHSVDVHSLVTKQRGDPRVRALHVELARHLEADGVDRIVVLMLSILQKLGVELQDPLELEGSQVNHLINRHVGFGAAHNRCVLVHFAKPLLNSNQFLFVYKVRFIQEQPIRKCNLFDSFILDSLRLLFVEMLLEMLCIHQCDDAVQPGKFFDGLVHEERLRNRPRIRQPSGFYDYCVQR
mmetsp:Transcript_26717/g.58639  ORF Transcript_26717/g.58639 Transcript_26717/m.58639 type:complete len:277 (+) Transcript_26717:544-1374(+)